MGEGRRKERKGESLPFTIRPAKRVEKIGKDKSDKTLERDQY